MKGLKTIVSIIAFLLLGSGVNAQTKTDSIIIIKGLANTYLHNGKQMTYGRMLQVLSSDKNTAEEVKKVKENYTFSILLGGAGGFMIGYALGQGMGGGNMNIGMMGIGISLIAIDIPFEIGKSDHLKKAINIYNKGQQKLSLKRLDYRLQITPFSVGFCMKF